MHRVPRRGSGAYEMGFPPGGHTNVILAAGFSGKLYRCWRWWWRWQRRALGRAENFETSPAEAPLVQPVHELRAVTSLPTRTGEHFFFFFLLDSFPYYNDFRSVRNVRMDRFYNSTMIIL